MGPEEAVQRMKTRRGTPSGRSHLLQLCPRTRLKQAEPLHKLSLLQCVCDQPVVGLLKTNPWGSSESMEEELKGARSGTKELPHLYNTGPNYVCPKHFLLSILRPPTKKRQIKVHFHFVCFDLISHAERSPPCWSKCFFLHLPSTAVVFPDSGIL